jgi:hypothetical protein
MIRVLSVSLIVLFLQNCASVTASKNGETTVPLKIVCTTSVQNGGRQEIRFEVQNSLQSDTLWLWQPYTLTIASRGDKTLTIRDCPCDAPCAPRPEEFVLVPKSVLVLYWNGKVTSCVPEQGQLRTVYQNAPKGNYRISMYYRTERYGEILTAHQDFFLTDL